MILKPIRPNSQAVFLRDVSISFPGSNFPILRNINFEVKIGETVALIGPSGSGKSTLARAILGLQKPELGQIRIFGLDPLSYVARNPGKVAYVPQSPQIISGTVFDNIALGAAHTHKNIVKAQKAIETAGLSSWLGSLTNGLEADLNKTQLSGGESQRIGFARAIFSDAKLIILDEPTSSLDADTEAQVSKVIESLAQKTAVIIIAHRLSTIQKSSRVYVLENGAITGSGSFQELRKTHPLVKRQSKLLEFRD